MGEDESKPPSFKEVVLGKHEASVYLEVGNQEHVEVVDDESLVALADGVEVDPRVDESKRQQAVGIPNTEPSQTPTTSPGSSVEWRAAALQDVRPAGTALRHLTTRHSPIHVY